MEVIDIVTPKTQIGSSLVFKRFIVVDQLEYRLFEILHDFSQMLLLC